MYGEEYTEDDVAIEQEFDVEDQKDMQDDVYTDMTPNYQEKDDLWSLFWKVVRTGNTSKVGNLNKDELGMLNISVRDCQRIALLADTLKHTGFGNFFRLQSEIILSTSCSRDGALVNLFVSQKKFSTKARGTNNLPNQQQQHKKRTLFSSAK